MIPANIGTALIIFLALAVFFLIAAALLRWMAATLEHRRAKRREPETFGDAGGYPTDRHQSRGEPLPAPDIDSGLLAGSDLAIIQTGSRRLGSWPDPSTTDRFGRAG